MAWERISLCKNGRMNAYADNPDGLFHKACMFKTEKMANDGRTPKNNGQQGRRIAHRASQSSLELIHKGYVSGD